MLNNWRQQFAKKTRGNTIASKRRAKGPGRKRRGADFAGAAPVEVQPLEPRLMLAAEIRVTGNGNEIVDGDVSPRTADGTDFGTTPQAVGGIDRTFRVQNIGNSNLTLFTPSLPPGFFLVEGLSQTIAPGGSDTFTVRLNTSTPGTRSGEIRFSNNDSDENQFNFAIKGTVGVSTTGAEVTVLGNGVSILDGDATPSTTDHTNFGTTTVGGAAINRTFTVRNDGTQTLSLSGLVVPTGFSLVEGLPTSLQPGVSNSFTVRLDTATAGTKTGQISFTNNDSNESPFNFTITGIVGAVSTGPEVTVLGNGVSIADNDTTPSTTDATDFGFVLQNGTPISRTYTVRNDGTATLTTSGLVVPTGFTITEGLSASIAAGASDTFTVRLNTTTTGTKTGQISFTNNDSNENPFNFTITGTVGAPGSAPEVTVLGNNVSITDGDATPSLADGTDFGSVGQGNPPIVRTFTVRNDGTATLNLSTLVVPTGFTLTNGLVATLAPGASDTFTVQLESGTPGIKTGQVSFANNDSDENPFNFTITGVVSSPAPTPEVTVLGNGISITDGDTTPSAADGTDFGTISQGGAPVTRTFTVGNDGSLTLTTSGLTVPPGFTITEGLDASIAPGFSDTFTVQIDPTTAGTFTGQVSFGNNDSNENPFNFTITATVIAAAPEVSVTGNSITIADGDTTPNTTDGTDFGTVTVGGTPVSQVFTVRNDGTATLTTSNLVVPVGYTITEGLSASIAAGTTDTFTVRLDTTTAGTKSGEISFTNNDSNENPYNFAITGTVNPPSTAEATVLGNGIVIADGDTTPDTTDGTDFGTVAPGGTPVTRTFTVRNDGTATLNLSGLIVPTGYTVTEGLSATLAAGESDTFDVRLDTAVAGTKSGQINFVTNDPDENPYNFSITGTVGTVTGPEVTVLGNGISITDGDPIPNTADDTDFGSVQQGGAPVSRTFTVRNDGTTTLNLSALAVPTGFTVTEPLSASLAAGATDTFTVQLDTAVQGTKSGDITFTTNDPDENPFNFAIIGIVNPPAGAPEATVLGNGFTIFDGDTIPSTTDGTDFGSVAAGANAISRTFTVRNDGTATLNLSNLAVPTGYSISEGLSASLAPGASDTFTVLLATFTVGTKTGDISFTTNDADENPYNFAITGTVTPPVGPEVIVLGNGLIISDGDTTPYPADGTDFDTANIGLLPVDRTFVVRNDGNQTLNLSALTAPTGFEIFEGLSTTLLPGQQDTFTVRLLTTTAGTKTGQVTFTTNDLDENPYNFTIIGIVKAANTPEVLVGGGPGLNIIIYDGDTSPDIVDGTYFGTVTQGGAVVTRTFAVQNIGTAPLNITLNSLTVPTGFTITEGLVTVLAAGQVDNFTVQMDTTTLGFKSGNVSFNNNDSDENPFTFAISGNVIPPFTPEATVLGNGIVIADGDSTPQTADGTDFSTWSVGAAPVPRTFTVVNEGTQTLILGTLTVPQGFTIIQQPPPTIDPGLNGSFTIALDTSIPGFRTGQVSFLTNDGNENPYNFAVEGAVLVPGPEAIVFGNGIEIVDGDSTPDLADGTNFGTTPVGPNPISRTFTVRNGGTQTLTLSNLTVSNTTAFQITEGLDGSLASGASDTFTVQFNPITIGEVSAEISFLTNDTDESPYNFAITARAVSPTQEVTVLGNSIEIVDGDLSPSTLDGTDFGSVTQGGTPIQRTFIVRNDGNLTLTTSGLAVSSPAYSIVEGLSGSIAAGGFDTFTIELLTTTDGVFPGQISFNTNDANEATYNFSITGRVDPAASIFTTLQIPQSSTDPAATPSSTSEENSSLDQAFGSDFRWYWGMETNSKRKDSGLLST